MNSSSVRTSTSRLAPHLNARKNHLHFPEIDDEWCKCGAKTETRKPQSLIINELRFFLYPEPVHNRANIGNHRNIYLLYINVLTLTFR